MRFSVARLCTLAALMTTALAPAWAAQRCANFAAFADMTPIPEIYRQNGFRFDFGDKDTVAVEHTAIFWAHENASVKTPYAGKEVVLDLTARTGEQISVKAVNAAGQVVSAFDVPPPYNNPLRIRLQSAAGDIVKLKLEGGGNETGIAKVCVKRD